MGYKDKKKFGLKITKVERSVEQTPVHPIDPVTQINTSISSESNSSNINKDASGSFMNINNEELKLNDMKFLGELGRGAGGSVSKALHTPTGRIFAIKIIPLDIKASAKKQLMLEMKALYDSNSPYIIKFYGAFFDHGATNIVMEYMNSGSLKGVMTDVGIPIPEDVLSCVAKQVLLGLHYLHKSRHLIHRDLKPSNILVDTYGNVKLTDFGVSQELASTISSVATFVGTAGYMSPERVEMKPYTSSSDIWSLGITLLEMLTREHPYGPEGMSFFEVLSKIVEFPVPEPPIGSSEMKDFLSSCLKKDPDERPSAKELLDHEFITKYEDVNVNIIEWATKNKYKNSE